MIQVDEKETIRRLHFIQRYSIREISKELHHSRKTIRKAIRRSREEWKAWWDTCAATISCLYPEWLRMKN